MMKIRYDADADAMYIQLRDKDVADTEKIDNTTIVDYDSNGNVTGFELLFVQENNPNMLDELHVENIAVTA